MACSRGLPLLQCLVVDYGKTFFTIEDAVTAGKRLLLTSDYVRVRVLGDLERRGMVQRLKRGLYCITPESGFDSPPSKTVIATRIFDGSWISHWSAISHYGLTEQIPPMTYVSCLNKPLPPKALRGENYFFVRVSKSREFGIEKQFIDGYDVPITDVERTLVDGLISPQHCGDFNEVLHAFRCALNDNLIDLDEISTYALRIGVAVSKRLGFIMESYGVKGDIINGLKSLPIRKYVKLDPQRPEVGDRIQEWNLVNNTIGGLRL